MSDPWLNSVEVRIPARASVDTDVLDDAVEAAVATLGSSAEYDGTGSDGESFDLFLYAADPDRLIDTLLERIEFPAGTVAHVTLQHLEDRSTTTYRVTLAGRSKGKRTAKKTVTSRLAAGDWFLFPLADSHVVARVSHLGKYQMVFYVFGDRRTDRPTVEELVGLAELGPDDAIAYLKDNDVPLERGDWEWLGPHGRFDPADWPLPEFEFVFTPTGRHYVESYPDGLDSDFNRSIEIPESEWWQRSETGIYSLSRMQGIVERAIDDPPNKYRMPPK